MTAVVIDANLAVALLVERPWSAVAERQMLAWKSQKVRLCAPALWPSEVVSALRKAVHLHLVDHEDALKLISAMDAWNIEIYLPDAALNCNALIWAERLGQMVAYDAQYLALAERLNADFYTADRRLFNRCQEMGVQFVRVID